MAWKSKNRKIRSFETLDTVRSVSEFFILHSNWTNYRFFNIPNLACWTSGRSYWYIKLSKITIPNTVLADLIWQVFILKITRYFRKRFCLNVSCFLWLWWICVWPLKKILFYESIALVLQFKFTFQIVPLCNNSVVIII